MLIVTTNDAPGYRIVKTLGLARGRAASNRAVPPMTQISSTPSSSAVSRPISTASSRVAQTRAPLDMPSAS